MQLLSKKFYNYIVPALIEKVKLYDIGNLSCGIVIYPADKKHLNILKPSREKDSLSEWKKVPFSLDFSEYVELRKPAWKRQENIER